MLKDVKDLTYNGDLGDYSNTYMSKLLQNIIQLRSAVKSMVICLFTGIAIAVSPFQIAFAGTTANPLHNQHLYVDQHRPLVQAVQQFTNDTGSHNTSLLLLGVAGQPGATWLTGPSKQDPQASQDVANVTHTSSEAARQKTVPVYVLYAIPQRDACAAYSKGGVQTDADYLA